MLQQNYLPIEGDSGTMCGAETEGEHLVIGPGELTLFGFLPSSGPSILPLNLTNVL